MCASESFWEFVGVVVVVVGVVVVVVVVVVAVAFVVVVVVVVDVVVRVLVRNRKLTSCWIRRPSCCCCLGWAGALARGWPPCGGGRRPAGTRGSRVAGRCDWAAWRLRFY